MPKGSAASGRVSVLPVKRAAAPLSCLRSKGFSPSLPPMHTRCRDKTAAVLGAHAFPAGSCTQHSHFIIHLPSLKQALSQNLGGSFTYFSPKSCFISCGSGFPPQQSSSYFHSPGIPPGFRPPPGCTPAPGSSGLRSAAPAAQCAPAPAVKVIPSQRVADGRKMHPDLMGAARYRHTGCKAQAVFCF